MKQLGRFLRTVRHLRAIQICNRLYRAIKPIRVGTLTRPSLRTGSGPWLPPLQKARTMLGPSEFVLLNCCVRVEQWQDWNNAAHAKLLLYNLHYMDDLSASGAAERCDWHKAIIDRWIEENPVLIGNGWEPYPLSLRMVNWIKWQLAGNTLDERALANLYLQARVLAQSLEYHLLANHLFANAVSLVFAGCIFDGSEASRWRDKGERILAGQLDEQILEDGAHFERSPAYHAVILDNVLDLINIGRKYDADLHTRLAPIAGRMLHWLSTMSHPDRDVAYFNDSVCGVAPTLDSLGAYALRLGITPVDSSAAGLESASGYYRFDTNRSALIVDAGDAGPDYQPGHAHCDCLSFELSVDGRRRIVNTGVSTYEAGDRRMLERSTSSHNTVSVDGLEQHELWGAFRVGRRARPVEVEATGAEVSAAHSGFRQAGLMHRRSISSSESGIEIVDTLDSSGSTASVGTANFHFHPDVLLDAGKQSISFDGHQIDFENAISVDVQDYEWCRGFYDRVPAKVARVRFTEKLTSTIRYAHPVSDR